MTRYGFIGLGSMGSRLAVRLANLCEGTDSSLAVWNRTRRRDDGSANPRVTVAAGPPELVAGSDVVVVMLPDLEQLTELTDGPADVLKPTVVADGLGDLDVSVVHALIRARAGQPVTISGVHP